MLQQINRITLVIKTHSNILTVDFLFNSNKKELFEFANFRPFQMSDMSSNQSYNVCKHMWRTMCEREGGGKEMKYEKWKRKSIEISQSNQTAFHWFTSRSIQSWERRTLLIHLQEAKCDVNVQFAIEFDRFSSGAHNSIQQLCYSVENGIECALPCAPIQQVKTS